MIETNPTGQGENRDTKGNAQDAIGWNAGRRVVLSNGSQRLPQAHDRPQSQETVRGEDRWFTATVERR